MANTRRHGKRDDSRDELPSPQELARRLADSIEALAIDMLGPPALKQGSRWRWGTHGSLLLNIKGPRKGRWFSFEEGRGGDALDLIVRGRGLDFKAAMKCAREWLGDV